MALSDITTTSGNVYTYVSALPGRVIRSDITNGTLQSPKLLETAHTSGTTKRSSKSLIKLSRTVLNTDSIPKNYSVHVVITRDLDAAVTDTLVNNTIAEMADILADAPFLASFTKGGHQ